MKIVKNWAFPDFDFLLSNHVQDFPETDYQQDAINEAIRYVSNFNLAVDIGANVGLHSVRFSKLFNNVISFEPSTYNFECLEKNCSSINNVILYKLGLGNSNRTEIISIPKSYDNCGAFSILDFKSNITEELINESIEINCLDLFSLSPDLIKVDTQGYELQVLQGAIETLKNSMPTLILEVSKKNFFEINNFLEPLGYTFVNRFGKDMVWRKND